ncbi:hypothetical protein LARV_01555 [Longilinea arvoryzae]|uniref:Uncharacterized protein n=1 Tax=Longilinea arvoryzae TaxID=360412 RepID=A0A0S7BHR8_9CHLR|nr:DUF6056 family protein [Longilinea arvoryzae]GAP13800.1 hypothetical protein LARV_01555 [Longilinea arvoryzae]
MKSTLQKALKIGWGATAAGFLAALGMYAWIGSFMRFMGDDYCYGMVLAQKGFWQAQWYSYVYPTPYTGDRFSLTFFSDLFHLFGPGFTGWLAGLTLALWISGLALTFRQITRLLRRDAMPVLWMAGAAAFAFFVLYQAPDLAESFYWRSGMLPYFMPLIGDTWLAALLLASIQKEHSAWPEVLGIGLLAFVNSGFSETAVAFQVGGLGVGLVAALILDKGRKTAGRSWKRIGVAMVGTLAAMVVMLLSPSNTARLNTLPDSLGFWPSIRDSLQYGLDFTLESLRGLPVPTLLGLVFSSALGLEMADGQTSRLRVSWWQGLLGTALILGFGFALVVCSMAPSVFIQTWYPEPRALIVSRFGLELTLFSLGGWIGWFLRGVISSESPIRLIRVVAVLAALVCAVYGVRGAARPLVDLPAYHQYAAQWDQRDAQIRLEAKDGVRDVKVVGLSHLLLRGGDFNTDAGHWYNNCAAGYYGVDSIRALP